MTAAALRIAEPVLPAQEPRPFLKWAGGKRQLLPELLDRLPWGLCSPTGSGHQPTYHEPFVGGGALFFALRAKGLIAPSKARLSDVNPELVNAYKTVRDRVEKLILCLSTFRNEQQFFYEVRRRPPGELNSLERAARFIYLNKTCFNGLYRENKRGEFNVPFGRYVAPRICAADELRAASSALRGVCIEVSSFDSLIDNVESGDFVYCDPPYAPLTPTASFTSYSRGGFSEEDQKLLAHIVVELGHRGASVLLSNSAVPLTRSLYKGLHVEQILAKRAINSRGDRRGPVAELLVAAGPLAVELRRRDRSKTRLRRAIASVTR